MKKGTPRHPKTKALARQLKIPLSQAAGMLALLWDYASDSCPDGGVGRMSDEDIAEVCAWPRRKTRQLLAALTDESSRFLDFSPTFRLYIHDWHEHCEDTVHRKLARAGKLFANGAKPKLTRLSEKERKEAEEAYTDRAHAERQTCARCAPDVRPTCALPLPLPIPEPEPEPEPNNVRAFRSAASSAITLPPEYEGFDFAGWFEDRWKVHPIPGRPQLAQQYAGERIFRPAPDGFLPDDFARVHDAWCEYWKAGDSAPCKLEVFIVDGWWRKMPPAVKARADPRKSAAASALDRLEL